MAHRTSNRKRNAWVVSLLDSGGGEVLQLDADERRAMRDELGLSLPPDGRPQCQHMVADEPYHGEHESRHSGSVTDGELSRWLARQVCGMCAGHLESDLSPRVARAHHKHGTFLELRGVTVLARMELHDARMEIVGEGGDLRDLVGARRDDHVSRFETAAAGRQDEAVILPGESVHLDACSNGELEPGRVGREIVGHLVLGWKRHGGRGEAPARQSTVPSRGEQAKRVPALAPSVADPLVGIQDYERTALLL
jgi:hypothetical protein